MTGIYLLSDPRVAEAIVRIVDRRVAEQLAAQLPRTRYGVVTAVGTGVVSVQLAGDATAAPGFAFPPRMSPVVGNKVRVVITPSGDRYVDEIV